MFKTQKLIFIAFALASANQVFAELVAGRIYVVGQGASFKAIDALVNNGPDLSIPAGTVIRIESVNKSSIRYKVLQPESFGAGSYISYSSSGYAKAGVLKPVPSKKKTTPPDTQVVDRPARVPTATPVPAATTKSQVTSSTPANERSADSTKKSSCKIALTFDDGPGPYTNSLMNYMEDKNVKGTFFVQGGERNGTLGNWDRYPGVADRIIASPLFDVGHHSRSHVNFGDQIKAGTEITKLLADQVAPLQASTKYQDAVTAQGGRQFFRLPYGSGFDNSKLKNALDAKKFTPSNVRWDIDPDDWAKPKGVNAAAITLNGKPSPSELVRRIMDGYQRPLSSIVNPGLKTLCSQGTRSANLLLHDIHPNSVQAAKDLIAKIQRDYPDWEFVHIDELPLDNGSLKWADGEKAKGFGH